MSEQLKIRISILSQLANADGHFDIRELAFIYNVCLRNQATVDSIGDIICQPDPVISLDDLTAGDRASYLTDVLLLMMIDGKVLPKEIQFSLEIGRRLGFDSDALHSFIMELRDQEGLDIEYIRQRVDHLTRSTTKGSDLNS
jgi:hypothetical protein